MDRDDQVNYSHFKIISVVIFFISYILVAFFFKSFLDPYEKVQIPLKNTFNFSFYINNESKELQDMFLISDDFYFDMRYGYFIEKNGSKKQIKPSEYKKESDDSIQITFNDNSIFYFTILEDKSLELSISQTSEEKTYFIPFLKNAKVVKKEDIFYINGNSKYIVDFNENINIDNSILEINLKENQSFSVLFKYFQDEIVSDEITKSPTVITLSGKKSLKIIDDNDLNNFVNNGIKSLNQRYVSNSGDFKLANDNLGFSDRILRIFLAQSISSNNYSNNIQIINNSIKNNTDNVDFRNVFWGGDIIVKTRAYKLKVSRDVANYIKNNNALLQQDVTLDTLMFGGAADISNLKLAIDRELNNLDKYSNDFGVVLNNIIDYAYYYDKNILNARFLSNLKNILENKKTELSDSRIFFFKENNKINMFNNLQIYKALKTLVNINFLDFQNLEKSLLSSIIASVDENSNIGYTLDASNNTYSGKILFEDVYFNIMYYNPELMKPVFFENGKFWVYSFQNIVKASVNNNEINIDISINQNTPPYLIVGGVYSELVIGDVIFNNINYSFYDGFQHSVGWFKDQSRGLVYISIPKKNNNNIKTSERVGIKLK